MRWGTQRLAGHLGAALLCACSAATGLEVPVGPSSAPFDAAPDAPPAADASLDVSAPPDASADPRTHGDAGCAPLAMVLERRWPFPDEPLEHPDRTHVTSTPLVLPPTREGEATRLAFVSHGRLVSTDGELVGDGPLENGRMAPELGGVLRIVDLATRRTVSWSDPEVRALAPTATLAAGDLDGDGELELVALGSYGHMHAFELDGEALWSATAPPYAPLTPPSPRRTLLSVSGAPIVRDLESDGTVEVIFGHCVVEGASGRTRFCVDSEALSASQGYWGPLVHAVDLDGDGALEVLAGRVAYRADGRVLWRLRDELYGFSAVGDFLADRPGSEVALVRQSRWYVLDPSDGAILDRGRLPGAPFLELLFAGGPPLVADLVGDGGDALVIANRAEVVMVDPDCRGCEIRWKAAITDHSGVTGVSAADLDGDGLPEVVHADETELRVLEGRTGRTRHRAPNHSRTRTEYPVVADVDADGSAEIVVGSGREHRPPWETDPTPPGIAIYGERHGRWVRVGAEWLDHTGSRADGRWARTLGPGAPFEAGCVADP